MNHPDFLDKLAEAKRMARESDRGRVWLVQWPAKHITVETSPVLLKNRDCVVWEVSPHGSTYLA